MSTFLFSEIVFGPVKSRRLGSSLGINLLPTDCKVCNFDCIYCECGWTEKENTTSLPSPQLIENKLIEKLIQLKKENISVDTITFAGNGEPTIHPRFSEIIDITNRIRKEYLPHAKVAVLSNSTMLGNQKIYDALKKVDMNILKLDSAFEKTVKLLNKPTSAFSIEKTIENLKKFEGDFILQTMFVKGSIEKEIIDNTSEEEIEAWLKVIDVVQPHTVMIYTISRDTPIDTLDRISEETLNIIADKVRKKGIEVSVST